MMTKSNKVSVNKYLFQHEYGIVIMFILLCYDVISVAPSFSNSLPWVAEIVVKILLF